MNSLVIFVFMGGFLAAQTPVDFRALEKKAEAEAQKKNWSKVAELLNPQLDLASPTSLLKLATAYHELQDYANLARVLNRLAEKHPKDSELQYILGDAYLKLAGQTNDVRQRPKIESQGVEALRASIKLKRKFLPAHQALVNYFIAANLGLETREQLTEMVKIFGERDDLLADLCRVFTRDGFLAQAVRHCQKAMQLAPNLPDNFVYLAQNYFDQGEMRKAESLLVRTGLRFPSSELAQYGAGQFYLTKSNYLVARKYLDKAVKDDATSVRAQMAFAQALFESGEEGQALDHFVAACRIQGTHQSAILAAAGRLRLKNNSTLAAKYSQTATQCSRTR